MLLSVPGVCSAMDCMEKFEVAVSALLMELWGFICKNGC